MLVFELFSFDSIAVFCWFVRLFIESFINFNKRLKEHLSERFKLLCNMFHHLSKLLIVIINVFIN